MKRKLFLLILLALALGANAQAPTSRYLWGMTPEGGTKTEGVIFRTDADGQNQQVVHNFMFYSGKNPACHDKVIEYDNKLYGLTYYGGVSNAGVLYEYDPATGAYDVLVNFSGSSGDRQGSGPVGYLLKTTDNMFYGTTEYGGSGNYGVLFKYDPATKSYINYDLANSATYIFRPTGCLAEANGKIYGMVQNGGTNYLGSLYEFDPATGLFDVKVSFSGVADGQTPYGGLTMAPNGRFYGMTQGGGVNGEGIIFEYVPGATTVTKKIDFDGSNGAGPWTSLLLASNNKFYGTTQLGGQYDNGVLFEYDYDDNTCIKKFDFYRYGDYGGYPVNDLMQASNGKIYGMNDDGGDENFGVLFEYDPTTNEMNLKFTFDGTNHGSTPKGSLFQHTNGKIYGTTSSGGVLDAGTIFEYEAGDATITKKIDFNAAPDGRTPCGSLLMASNGKMYGMTLYGGIYPSNYGVIFEFNPADNEYTKKVDFDWNNGCFPYGSLMQASNEKVYGMTSGGSTYGTGVLFEYTPGETSVTSKVDFDLNTTGGCPYGSLIEAADGKLYGMTNQGGSNGAGVLFEYDPAGNVFTKRRDFEDGNASNGSYPYGNLTRFSDRKLYGLTSDGGLYGQGTLFEYDVVSQIFSIKVNFSSSSKGSSPYGSLVKARNGLLYGMTSSGGANNNGVLFEYNPVNDVYTKKFEFASDEFGKYPHGYYPRGSLYEGTNGKLYGMTSYGGVNGLGVLFEYVPGATTVTKKVDFDGNNGSRPQYGELTGSGVALVWNGAQSSDWSAAGNWTPEFSPTRLDVVEIASGANNPVINEPAGSPAECNSLEIAAGGSLTIASGKALTVPMLVNDAGNTGLIIESDATGTGSLIHNSAGIGATVKSYVDGSATLTDNKYHFASIPTQYENPTANLFLGSYLFKLDPSQRDPDNNNYYGKWVGLGSSPTTPLSTDQGYMIYYPGDNHTYAFEGNLNNGGFSVLLTGHASTNTFNLVPNPYPSSLNWQVPFGWTKTGIENKTWIYNNGVYASYTGGDTPDSTNGGSRFIAPGQAFTVNATEASPALAMDNRVRVHYAGTLLKSAEGYPNRLSITAACNGLSDEIVVKMVAGATTGYDAEYDMLKMGGGANAPQLSSMMDGQRLSINALPYDGESRVVPVEYQSEQEGSVALTFSGLDVFDVGTSVYWKDLVTGQVIDLRMEPYYTFNHQAGNSPMRFQLIFGSSIGEQELAMQQGKVWIWGDGIYISAPGLSGELALVEVFDITGQRCYSKETVLTEMTTINAGLQGIKVVRITTNTTLFTCKGYFNGKD